MELLEQRQMLAADFDLSTVAFGTDKYGLLKIDVRDDDTKVYLRTEPNTHQLQYRYDLGDAWESSFDDKSVTLDAAFHEAHNDGFKIEVGTGLDVSVDIADARNSVVILTGIETSGSSLEVTSSIDVSITGDVVTDEGALVIELKDTTNIFGGTFRHNASKLTIGPVNSEANEDADFFADDHLTIHAGDLTLDTRRQSQKSAKQVVGLDNIESKVLVSDALIDVAGEIKIKSTASADLLGDEDGLWGTHFSQYVGYAIDATLPHVPVSFFYRQAESAISIKNSTVSAVDDIYIDNQAVAIAKGKAIAAKPVWSKENSKSRFDTLSAGVTVANGSAQFELIKSDLISYGGNVKVKSNAEVISNITARTTNNINARSPAHDSGYAFSVSVSDTMVTSLLDADSSITAQGDVLFASTGKVENSGTANSATYDDGSVGITGAFGYDTTTIETRVDGDIDAGGLELSPLRFSTDQIGPDQETITSPDHGLVDGESVVYFPDAGSPVLGDLIPGELVLAKVLNSDQFQLYLNEAIDLGVPDGNQEARQSLWLYQTDIFDPLGDVDLAADTFNMPGNGFVTGERVRYGIRPPTDENPSDPIGGLFDSADYYVISSSTRADHFQLAVTETDAFDGNAIDLIDYGIGSQHYFTYLTDSRSFSPYTDLDSQANSITLDTSGINTGDPLYYRVDPEVSSPVNLDRHYGFNADGLELKFDATGTLDFDQPVIDPTNLTITVPNHGWDTGQPLIYLSSDEQGIESAPILLGDDAFLESGTTYYVIKVNDDLFQLSDDSLLQQPLEIADGGESGVQRFVNAFDSNDVQLIEPSGTVQWLVVNPQRNSILFPLPHDLVQGQRVTYFAGLDEMGLANLPIPGLVDGADYYVSVVSDLEIQLTPARRDVINRDIYTNLSSVNDGVLDLGLGATSGLLSPHSFVGYTVDTKENWIVVPGHELEPGQEIQYLVLDGAPVGGLQEGAGYFAYPLDRNTIRVASSLSEVTQIASGSDSWINLQEGGAGTLHLFKTSRIALPFQAARAEPVVDLIANTIQIDAHGLQDRQLVNYQTSNGLPIGGLEDSGTYEVIYVGPNHIKLAKAVGQTYLDETTPVGDPLDLTAGATLESGMHLFRVIPSVSLSDQSDPVLLFDPTEVPPVDVDNNRLRVLGNRLEKGDPFLYLSGGDQPVGGLVDGVEYYAIPVLDDLGNSTEWIQLAANAEAAMQNNPIELSIGATGYTHSLSIDSSARQSDLPIVGLGSEITYYAIVDGPNQLRLAETPLEALGAVPQNLESENPQATGDYGVENTDGFSGIRIESNLKKVKNKQAAGTQIGSQPTLSDLITKPEVVFRRNTDGFKNHSAPPGKAPDADRSQFLAGVAINLASHDVNVLVGQPVEVSGAWEPTTPARLTSASNIEIFSGIKQLVQTKAQGDSVVDRGKKFVFAAGFAFTDLVNESEAILGNNAILNAVGSIDVDSVVKYPLLVEKRSLIPFNLCYEHRQDSSEECHPIADIATYADGKLGLTRVLNTWANSKAFAPTRSKEYDEKVTNSTLPKATVTGSVGYANYTNRSEAIISSGAEINQDLTAEQLVQTNLDITAKTDVTLVGLAGIMHLKLNEVGLLKSKYYYGKNFDTIGNAFSLTANKSSSFGLGLAFMEQFLTNHVHAVIQEGALVKSGQATIEDDYGNPITTGIRVEAKSPSKTFNFTQSGANSEGAAVALSQGMTKERSETIALVGDGVSIQATGPLEVASKSDALHSVGSGGFAFGDSVGIGLSAATVLLDRHTGAVVGKTPEEWTQLAISKWSDGRFKADNPEIAVDKLLVESANIGQQTSVSVVGAKAEGNNRAAGAFSKGAVARTDSKSKVHFGLAGDTAVNVGNDKTTAAVDFSGSLVVKDDSFPAKESAETDTETRAYTKVKAKNETDYLAVTGAASITWNGPKYETATVAMTAAVSVNELDLTTQATVGGEASVPEGQAEGEWHMGSLAIETASHGDVLAVAVALGISQLDQPEFSLNAAFSWASNPMIDRSHSYLEPLQHGSYHIEGEHAIDLELKSTNDRSINASSGAATFSFGSAVVGVGIGVSPAVNDITIETLANIQPGVSLWTDVVEIQAFQNPDIEAWSMAGSGEFPNIPPAGIGTKAVDVQTVGSIAINRLTSKSRATIGGDPEQGQLGRVTLHDVGEITAESKNQSDIKAIAGEGFISLRKSGAEVSVAVGLAFGLNEISEDSFSEAMLVGVDALEARGDIHLASEFAPRLKAVSVAVSLGVIFSSGGSSVFAIDGVGASAINVVGAIDNKRDHKGKRTAIGIRNSSGIQDSTIDVAEDALGDLYDITINASATSFEREGEAEYNETSVISQVHDIDLSVDLSTTAVSAAVGISYTSNEIAVDSHAVILNSEITNVRAIDVTATNAGAIHAVGSSSSLNVGIAQTVSLGFLGTFSLNIIESEAKAYVEGGSIEYLEGITAAENPAPAFMLNLQATDESEVSALAIVGHLGVTANTKGFNVTLEIPYSTTRNWLDNEIFAGVIGDDARDGIAVIDLPGDIQIKAIDESVLVSNNNSVGADFSYSSSLQVTLNAASAISDNTVTNNVVSVVRDAEVDIDGDLMIVASTHPQHLTLTRAIDVAAAAGKAAFSGAVAVSKAVTTLGGVLSASIGTGDGGETSVNAGGSIEVFTEVINENDEINLDSISPAYAVSLAAGVDGASLSISADGSTSQSITEMEINSSVEQASVRAADGVHISATDNVKLRTDTKAVSVSLAFGISIGVALTKSQVINTNTISAFIDDSSVTSDQQDVVVNAFGGSELLPEATTTAVALLGAAVGNTNLDAIYRSDGCDDEKECGPSISAAITDGSQVFAPLGGVVMNAVSDVDATSSVNAHTAAAIAVDVVSQKVQVSPKVTTSIDRSTLEGAKVIANAISNDLATTQMRGGDGGVLSINVANISSDAKPVVTTEVQGNAQIDGVTQVILRAESTSSAEALLGPDQTDGNERELNIGGITVSASDSFATVAPTVDVNVGFASVHSGGELLIDAVGGRLMEQPTASVFDAETGVDANADGLDANTIEFTTEHGLGYGDAIQYASSDTSNTDPVGGLTPGEIYRAIPRDATIIRLGSVLVTGAELSVYHSNTPITWHQAVELAEAAGGRLASLTSEAENNDALSLLPEGQEAWIGGTDQAKNGTWTWELPGSEDIVFWIDGQIVDAYSDWAEGAPDAAVVGMDFAAIENSGERSAGTWVTKTSEETLSYYVVASPNSDAVDLLKDQLQFNNPHYLYGAQPNDGGEFGEDALAIAASGYWFDMPTMDEIPAYIYIDGTSGEFKFAPSTGDTGWTFQAAVADAKNAGRVLAQPLTQTENDAIKQLMIDNGVTEAWLGGNDFNEEGTWVWNGTGEVFWQGGLDGEAVNGAFTNFASATQVIYDAGVIPIGGLVDGETYLVREIDLSENILKLEHPDQLPNAPVDFDGAAIANEAGGFSVFNIAGHGFTNGQIVTYRAAKPLQFNTLDVDADSKTVTPHNENATFDIDNPDQQAALLTVGQQVVYAANATNSQWYWLPNAYEETSDQPFWPQGDSIQNDPPYVNWNDSAPTSINTQFSAVMIDDGTWKNVDGTLDITGYLLERPQFQVSPGTSKANYFADAVDGWKEVWPATITSEDEWEAALEAIGEKNVYLGGSDGQDANTWRWDSASPGPEAGQQFWDGKSKGDAKNGYPTFWADGEPNDSGLHNKETQLLMYYDTGLWNDVSGDQTHPWLVESNRFTFIPFSGTYEEALADAASQGGWLATIRSDEENEAALNALETASSGMLLWIGASLGQNNRDWMWVGSDTAPASVPLAEPVERDLTYTNWYAGEPNNFNNDENYIQMYADSSYKGMWNDNNGATLLGGYLLEKDGDFELITGTYNWNQAFQDAKERGGQLATINNSSEQELAQSKLGSSSVWIGGTDEGHEGTFKWVEMEGYQNWASNEPSLNGEQYAHLRSDGMWNDRSATSELTGYLLEIDGDYSIVTGTFTWVQAKEDAEARGGHLAIIDTAEKQQTAQLVARRFAYLGATANQLIDGLEAGEAYYVTSADGDNYQLSSSSGGTPIAISGQNKSSAVNHYLIPANQQPIEGLREGQSYYVIAIDEKSFRLAATLEDWAEGTSIAVSGNDNSGNGYSGMIGLGSTLGTEGLDLTDAGQGRHKFIVDLTEKGAGDQSFAFVSPGWRPPFDLGINHGEAKAVTTGGGGGLVGVGMPRAMATSEPDVGVSIEVGARLQGETVYVNSRTHANADSYVDNTFVGILVEAGNSLARTLATETSQVEVLGSIHADTDLHVSATNEDNLSAQATTNGGGLLPTQFSWSRVTHQYTTEVLLDDFARLSAGNELKIEAHSTFDDEMVSMAKAGGAIGNMKANTIEDTNSELTDDLKNLGVRIGTEDNPSTASIDLAASYLNARAITLDAAVNDATASAYSEVRGAGLMTKRATATSRFYDDTNVTINDDAVLHASDEIVIGANHRNLDIHTHANFYRNGKSGWFSLRTDTLVDTQSRIDVDDTVEILANSLELDALHDEVDVQTRLTYGRVDYSDAYDFSSSDYKDLPEDSSRNDSGSDSQIFNTLNEINFNATVHFKDRRYLQIDDQGVVTEADGITLGNGTITPGYQYQAGDLILVDPINYQSSGTAFNALNYLVSAETHLTDQEWALSDTTSNKLMGTPTLASASSVSVINDSLSPMEIQGIDLDPRQGNQAGLADSLTLKPDDGSIDTSQWAPGTETDSGQSLGLFRIENTNPDGSDLIISGDIDAGLGQIHLVTLGGDLLAGSTQTLSTHLTAAAIILDAPSGDVIGNPDGAAEPFTLEFLERPTYPDRVQRRDPDAYWRLGDTSGLEAVDQSGNDHNGTYGTDVELEQTGALVGGNTSVRFTGSTGSYVEGADFTPTGLDGQTVSGWFMVETTDFDWQAVYFMGDPGTGPTDYTNGGENRENTFWVGRDGFLHWAIGLQDQAAQYEVTTDAGIIMPGRWYHFATVLDSANGQMQLMLNGELVESRSDLPTSSKVRSESGNWLLANSPSKESGYHGRLDEVAIINRALTQGEVSGLYLAFGPAADAHWRMNDASTVRMEDRTVNQIDGRYFNVENAVNASPQGLENAAYLDGGQETYMAVGQNDILDSDVAQTITAWIKVEAFSDNNPYAVFVKQPTDDPADASSGSLSLYVDSSGTLNLFMPLADGTSTLLNSDAGLIDTERWHQVTAVIDTIEQTVGIFVDGLLSIEATLTGSDSSNTLVIPDGKWRLGNDFSGQSGFRGWMWNVSIRDEPLKPFAIATQYGLIFRRPNILQPRNVRAQGDVDLQLKALVNDDREESSTRFNLIETDGNVDLLLLTPDLIGEQSLSAEDYVYSLESIVAGGNLTITSDQATSLDDAVGLETHFQLTNRPTSNLRIDISGSVLVNDDRPRVVGDELLNAGINSDFGNIVLSSAADVRIEDHLKTGQDSSFTWGGSGQILGKGQADSDDLIAGALLLGASGGLGMPGEPLRTNVTRLVGSQPTGPVHVYNDSDSLTIGNLIVDRGDLELVNSHQVLVNRAVSVTGGGDIVIAANDQSTSNLLRAASQTFQRQVRFTFSNWSDGEPNNANGNQNYLQMYAIAGYEGKWDDLDGNTALAGYLLELDGDYELIKESFTWHQAINDAQSRGGQLATIQSQEDQNRAEALLEGFNIWLGGTDQGHEGDWTWVTLSRYQNWALNQPDNNNGTEHYAHLRTDGTWNDLPGDSLIDGYLLEIDGVYSAITFDDKISWFDANRDARERGGQLATIGSEKEQLRAQGVANNKQLWIGATDIQNPGNWLWLEHESLVVGARVSTSGGDGDILLSGNSGIVVQSDLTLIQYEKPFLLNQNQYDNWHSGEPNNFGDGEDYLTMYADGTWNDSSGDSELAGYILEVDQQFHFIAGSFTWHQASYDAQSRGGRLAVLDSENDQLRAQNHNGGTTVWVGATDVTVEGEWKWVVSDNYLNWAENQPDNYLGNENYGMIRPTGEWNDLSGESALEGYLLETDGEFSVVQGGSYTWQEAFVDAQSKGGRLAVIVSAEAQARAEEAIADYDLNLWFGASDAGQEGYWKWVDVASADYELVISSSGFGDINLASGTRYQDGFLTDIYERYSQSSSLPIREASIVDVQASSELTVSPWSRQAVHVIDGSGLSASGDHVITPDGYMWLSNGTLAEPNDLAPYIEFDLGFAQSLDHLQIWNYNEALSGRPELLARGIEKADISIAGEDEIYQRVITGQTFAKAPGLSTVDFSETVDLSGWDARYIKLDNLKPFSGDDNNLIGLSEVKIFVEEFANESSIVMDYGSRLSSERGNISLVAPSDVTISEITTLKTGNGQGGTVLIVADYDGIKGTHPTYGGSILGVGDAANVIAEHAIFVAEGVEGLEGSGIGGKLRALSTEVSRIAAITDAGNISIENEGDLTIGEIPLNLGNHLSSKNVMSLAVSQSAVPVRISQLQEQIRQSVSIGDHGATKLSGLAVLDTGDVEKAETKISIKTTGNLTVMPDVPVFNLSGGPIILHAESDTGADSLFEVIPDKMTWEEAYQHAIDNDGRIANLTTEEIADFVGDSATPGRYWIGASDSTVDGTWSWLYPTQDGQAIQVPLSEGYTDWAAANPGNTADSDHAVIDVTSDGSTQSYDWYSQSGQDTYGYILEKQPDARLTLESPIFTSGGLGEIYLYQGSEEELLIPQPIPTQTCNAYLAVDDSGVITEGQTFVVSLDACLPTVQVVQPRLTAEGESDGPHYFFSTSELERNASVYADGSESPSARLTLQENGLKTIFIRVSYSDGQFTDYQRSIKVADIPLTSFDVTQVTNLEEVFGRVSLAGDFAGGGLTDQHLVVIDWGDRTAPSILRHDEFQRDFAVYHDYETLGLYEIQVAVTDLTSNDFLTRNLLVETRGASVDQGELRIIGSAVSNYVMISEMNDQIIVQLGDLDSSDPMEDRPSLSNVVTESYDPNAFESIVVYLSSGDDRLLVDLDTEHPITAYGGQDDDVMISQGSAVVFYGEQGADTLQGSHRNDLLDAGEGADHAIGGGGNDQIRIDSLEDRADGGDQYDQLIWVGPAIPFDFDSLLFSGIESIVLTDSPETVMSVDLESFERETGSQNLHIDVASWDQFDSHGDWVLMRADMRNGQYARSYSTSRAKMALQNKLGFLLYGFSDGTFALDDQVIITGPLETTNPVEPADVNNDGQVNARDALVVINQIGRNSKENSPNSIVSDMGTSTRLVFNDVNADNRVSAMDALQVINKLSRSESQENLAEGEQLESTWLPYQYDMDEASLLAIDRSTDAVYRQKDWETDNGEDRDSDDCSESDPKNLRGRIPSTTHHHSRVDEARDLIFLAFGRDDRQDAKDDTLDRDNFQGAREDALKSCLDVFYK